jgi:hypothetical protein
MEVMMMERTSSRSRAWILFAIIQLLILLVVSSGPDGPVGEGSVLQAFTAAETTDADLDSQLLGTVVWGMTIFGLAITLIPFRRGERWAWYVLWYYPVFFVIHIFAFGTLVPDAFFVAITTFGLLGQYRRFFPKESGSGRGHASIGAARSS